MDLKLNRETVPATERIFDGIQEQGVELDYILPDYYPDIFRLVRCEITPVITDYSVSGDKLSYELNCDIKIIYCGDNGSSLQCINQKQTFSKSVELGRNADEAEVLLVPKTDHVNFRAVNKRRLDIRGAVSVKICVTGEKNQEVISDAFGMNMQVKKVPLRFASKKLNAEKNIQLSEETELSPAQPNIVNVISSVCNIPECESKMISGKLLAKGTAQISILYSCEKDGEGGIESLSFSIPYSQVIDIDGIDEGFESRVSAETINCEVTPTGENRAVKCELELKLVCKAVKVATVMIVEDAFSTVYPCEVSYSDINAEQLPTVYNETFRNTAKLGEGENVPKNIYSVWVTPKNINTRVSEDGKSVIISGMLTYSMAAKDSSGMIVMPDKDEAFEETIGVHDNILGSSVNADVTVSDVSYNISSNGVLSAKSDLSAEIRSCSSTGMKAVTDIAVDDTVKKQRDGDYAVKLYFGVENEEVWDIAKQCSTSVSAIMEENELSGERLENGGMLLIPIKE